MGNGDGRILGFHAGRMMIVVFFFYFPYLVNLLGYGGFNCHVGDVRGDDGEVR